MTDNTKNPLWAKVEWRVIPGECSESPAHHARKVIELDNMAAQAFIDAVELNLARSPFGWCDIEVQATLKLDCDGTSLGYLGTAYLGACSYKSEDDFKRDGYYAQLQGEAFEDLLGMLRLEVKRGKAAARALAEGGLS